MDIISLIIELEWKQFSNVNNMGGKASCQEDKNTFMIMRKSQLMAWSEELLQSYYQDILNSNQNNHNMQTEKYARMMKYTSPLEYEKIEKYLPAKTDEHYQLVDQIAEIYVNWMEQHVKENPNLGNKSRSIRSNTDTINNTSYETYLKGELLTYKLKTLKIYLAYIEKLVAEDKNLVKIIMENTVKHYGYKSLEDAEKSK